MNRSGLSTRVRYLTQKATEAVFEQSRTEPEELAGRFFHRTLRQLPKSFFHTFPYTLPDSGLYLPRRVDKLRHLAIKMWSHNAEPEACQH